MVSLRPKIAIFNLNMTHRDPRVLRMSATLRAQGPHIAVFEMQQNGMPAAEVINGVTVYRVPIPQSYTDADMVEFERVCPAAARVIAEAQLCVYSNGRKPHRGGLRRALDWVAWPRPIPPACGAEDQATDWREVAAIRSIMLVNLAIFKAAEEYAPDIVHCNDLDTLLIGYMFKIKHGSRLIFDAHEIYQYGSRRYPSSKLRDRSAYRAAHRPGDLAHGWTAAAERDPGDHARGSPGLRRRDHLHR
jgi:hypothetical protein